MNLGNLKQNIAKETKVVKPERTYFSCIARDGVCGVYTGNPETSVYEIFDKTEEGALNCLKAILSDNDIVPDPEVELLDKQVAIYVLDCVADVFLTPGDMLRNKKFDDIRDLIDEVQLLAFQKRNNLVLRRIGKSKAKIVSEGFDWIKGVVKDALKNGGVSTSEPSAPAVTAEEEAKYKDLMAKIDNLEDQLEDTEDDDEADKLEKKIERLCRRAERQRRMMGRAQAKKAEQEVEETESDDIYDAELED